MIKQLTHISKKELSDLMSIWLESNIDAHPFIESSYWHEHFKEVQEALLSEDIMVYKRNENYQLDNQTFTI